MSRETTAVQPPRPGAALGRLLVRRYREEWRATPLHRLSLRLPAPTGLVGGARDLRPVDPEAGRRLLAGRLTLAGATRDLASAGAVWAGPFPSRAFAVEMQRFSWLPDLIAAGPTGIRAALHLTLEWERAFRSVQPFVWDAETLERRIFNWSCALRVLTEAASDREAERLRGSVLLQAAHLLRLEADPAGECRRTAAAAVAAAVLGGRGPERVLRRALARLSRALPLEVYADGGTAGRSPEAALELLFDLLTLDGALQARGLANPDALARALDRLTHGVRFFRLTDGRLAAFHGGEACAAARVGAALAHEDEAGRPQTFLPYGGFQRLEGRALCAVVDAAAPPEAGRGETACDHPLAFELSAGPDRLIVNAGWSPEAQGPEAFRLIAGGSTLSAGEVSPGRLLSGLSAEAFGRRLVGGVREVLAARHENERGVWLELSHDGYEELFGLRCERRLFLDHAADELRGEERLSLVAAGASRRRAPAHMLVRFHLHPSVQVSLARDKRSVLLRGPSARGWWFRNDAPEVLVEASTSFEGRTPQRGAQIVLRAPLGEDGARARWKLSPVEAEPRAPRGSDVVGGDDSGS